MADCICPKDKGQIIRVATESDIAQIQDILEKENVIKFFPSLFFTPYSV